MRIDGGIPMLRQTLMTALAGAAKDAGFVSTEPVASVTATPQVTAAPATTTSVDMLVALAAIDPVAERRRRLAVQADKGLALLERLRDAMVAGRPSDAQIAEMRTWAESFAPSDDPVLAPIAREIELRVRVELARYDVRA